MHLIFRGLIFLAEENFIYLCVIGKPTEHTFSFEDGIVQQFRRLLKSYSMTKFEETSHYREIILRGTYLSMAADVEWIMLIILSQIFKGHETDVDELNEGKPLNKFTLFEKICAVQVGLIRYHTQFYIDHQADFRQLQLLRGMRNKFGHGKVDFVDGDKENLWISEVTVTGIDKKQYQMSVLTKEIKDYWDSIRRFLDLVMKITGTKP